MPVCQEDQTDRRYFLGMASRVEPECKRQIWFHSMHYATGILLIAAYTLPVDLSLIAGVVYQIGFAGDRGVFGLAIHVPL